MVSQIIDDIEKEGLRSELCVTRIPFEVVSIDGEPVKTKTYFWAEPSVAKKITKLILEANNEQRETEEAKSKED